MTKLIYVHYDTTSTVALKTFSTVKSLFFPYTFKMFFMAVYTFQRMIQSLRFVLGSFVMTALIILFIANYSIAQDYSLNASKSEVEIGERFRVQLTIANFEPSQLKLPNFSPFKVVGGPEESQSISIINGKRSFSKSIAYILEAPRSGEFHISAATMTYKGQKLSTNSLTIKVVKTTNKESKDFNTDGETLIRLETESKNYYVGQQIMLDVVLYTRQNISRYEIIDEMKFPGFFATQSPSLNEIPRNETINGKEYYRQVLQKIFLFPQKSGNFKYDPIRCKIAINQDTGFGILFGETKYDQILSNALSINVKPLPEPTPSTFSGAVGNFDLAEVALSKNTIGVGESFQIRMTITGDGDPKVVQIPPINPISSIESYPPSVIKDETKIVNEKQHVLKTFEYTFVPKKDTVIKILPVFTFFSPKDNKYITLHQDSLTVAIAPMGATVVSTPPEGKLMQPNKNTKVFSDTPLFGSKIWYILLASLLGSASLGMFLKSRYLNSNDAKLAEMRTPEYKVKQHLEKAKVFLDQSNNSMFYEELHRAIQDFILQKYHIPIAQSGINEVQQAMADKGVSNDNVQTYVTLINKINEARFAGKSENTTAMYESAIALLRNLDAGL